MAKTTKQMNFVWGQLIQSVLCEGAQILMSSEHLNAKICRMYESYRHVGHLISKQSAPADPRLAMVSAVGWDFIRLYEHGINSTCTP